ncbi:ParB/RepB/Spo0J family partition protein [Sphaerotilaceae bacterium SBD11-9]
MNLSLDQFDLLATPADLLAGAPLQLPLDAIDEDPEQPRLEFEPDGLAELAASIKERGVLQPISVRRHPKHPDRWMLNFGARRLRASRLANRLDIPAFVDNAADSYDQVIENEQRDGLKPLELALFVQRRLAAGDIKAEIARRLGKSRQFVTMATALIDAPDWLMAAYREGRCRGLNELHELRKLAGSHPHHVEAWTSNRDAITRDRVTALRADLSRASADMLPSTSTLVPDLADRVAQDDEPPVLAPAPAVASAIAPRPPAQKLRLLARLDGAEVAIDTQSAPTQTGQVFVRCIDGGPAEAVDASRLRLVGLVSAHTLSI